MATQYLGYVKYAGALVEDGLMDARQSARALLGLDEAVRFFVGYQDPARKNLDYEMPVRVRPGSWEILLPHTVGQWIATGVVTGAGIVATEYLKTAAAKVAEQDFAGVSSKDIFTKALRGIDSSAQPARIVRGTSSGKSSAFA